MIVECSCSRAPCLDVTLDEAVAAVEATLRGSFLHVDRKLARQDATHFLLLVLDTSRGKNVGESPDNGPRLVDKRTNEVRRVTVVDALDRAERMTLLHAAPHNS